MTLNQWRTAFFQARQLPAADGRPLYAYRTTDAEFDELLAALQTQIQRYDGDIARLNNQTTLFAPLFVLFASEWWRREYAGGVWRWAPIIEQLAGQDYRWDAISRTACIVAGLLQWEHTPTASGKVYIGAIAVQGGLPLKLIAVAGGKISDVLQNVLRKAMRLGARGFEIEQLVDEQAGRLPISWQTDVLTKVIANTVEAVIELKRRYHLDSTSDPIAILDSKSPMWRAEFPLPIDNNAARSLLNDLITSASQASIAPSGAAFRISRELIQTAPGRFDLRARVLAPNRLAVETVAKALQCSPDALPRAWEFLLANAQEQVALNARRILGKTDEARLTSSNPRITGPAALAAQSITARSGGTHLGEVNPLPGAEALDTDLPWMFVQDGDTWTLKRMGSVTVHQTRVRFVVPKGCVFETDGSEPPSQLGQLAIDGAALDIRETQHDTVIHTPDGDAYRIRTNRTAAEPDEFCWHGRKLPYTGRPRDYWLSTPRLYRYTAAGDSISVPTENIVWRRSNTTTQLTGNAISGPVDALLVENGEVQQRWRFTVLGEAAAVALASGDSPSTGAVQLLGWQAMGVTCATPEIQSATAGTAGDFHIHLIAASEPPELVTLQVDWPGAAEPTELHVPFPASGARFFDARGRFVQRGELALDKLHGARLRIFDANPDDPTPRSIELALRGAGTHRPRTVRQVPEATGVRNTEIRLIDLHDDCAVMLASTDRLDAWVEITVLARGQPETSIRVQRYERALEFNGDAIALSPTCLREMTLDEIAQIEVRATSLLAPDEHHVSLSPSHSEGVTVGLWPTSSLTAARGPWLIHPARDSILQFRAVIAPGHGGDHPPQQSALLQAIVEPRQDVRLQALDEQLLRLARDHTDADWDYLEACHARFEHLPLSSLDLWVAARNCRPFLVALVLRQSERVGLDDMQRLMGRLAKELGVCWEAITIKQWFEGANTYRAALKAQLKSLPDHVAEILLDSAPAAWVERCERIAAEAPGLTAIASALAGNHAPESMRLQPHPDARLAGILSRGLWKGVDAGIQSYLLRGRANQANKEDWPAGVAPMMAAKLEKLARIMIDKIATTNQKQLPDHLFWPNDTVTFRNSKPRLDPRADVVHAPVLRAISTATDTLTEFWDSGRLTQLHFHRAFDPDWFAYAFDQTIRILIYSGCVPLPRGPFDPPRQVTQRRGS